MHPQHCEICRVTAEQYERTLYRLAAYWEMERAVITPLEVVKMRTLSEAR